MAQGENNRPLACIFFLTYARGLMNLLDLEVFFGAIVVKAINFGRLFLTIIGFLIPKKKKYKPLNFVKMEKRIPKIGDRVRILQGTINWNSYMNKYVGNEFTISGFSPCTYPDQLIFEMKEDNNEFAWHFLQNHFELIHTLIQIFKFC